MFSKRKDKISSWLDDALKERRNSFRYTPDAVVAIFAQVGADTTRAAVWDLSAGGCCFVYGGLRVGDVFELRLTSIMAELPLDIALRSKVLHCRQGDECHCIFLDLGEEAEETLHRFTLAAQRYEARYERFLRVQRLREKNE